MLNEILMTLDGSTLAGSVLPTVTELAGPLGARVTLLAVLNDELRRNFERYAESEGMEVNDAVRAYLSSKARELEEAGVEARIDLEGATTRPVAEVIVDYAQRQGIDLIAMSTHGRSGVARWLLGSVAEKVLRASPIPVLLARPEEARPSP